MINWSVLSGLAVNQDMAPRSRGPQMSHLLLLQGAIMLQLCLWWSCCQLSVRGERRILQAAPEKRPSLCMSMENLCVPFVLTWRSHGSSEWLGWPTAFRFGYGAKTVTSVSHKLSCCQGAEWAGCAPGEGSWAQCDNAVGGSCKPSSLLSFAIFTFRLLLSPVY